MIIFTLAGESSRFFKEGYNIVKYKLEFNGKSIIENILDYVDLNEKIIIVCNKKFNDKLFFETILRKKFKFFKIIEVNKTEGQLDTVYQGLLKTKGFWNNNDRLIVFNGDTIRKLQYNYSNFDGSIECFIQEGNHWSFVDELGFVSNICEKKRISKYCSTGFYEFRNVELLMKYYDDYKIEGEKYIAPFYNLLIKNGFIIQSFLSQNENFILCGTPAEYEYSIKKHG
jgi:hypothetical protein